MTKRDADPDIVIEVRVWHMTENMPGRVVQSEVEVLREHVCALFLRTRLAPTAALFACRRQLLALAHAEDKQDRLKVPPAAALDLETEFHRRLQRQLVHQRRRHRRGWTG